MCPSSWFDNTNGTYSHYYLLRQPVGYNAEDFSIKYMDPLLGAPVSDSATGLLVQPPEDMMVQIEDRLNCSTAVMRPSTVLNDE